MSRRYSDIERGNVLQRRLQALTAWRNRPDDQRGTGIGTRVGELARTAVYISPFGQELAANTFYRTNVTTRSRQQSNLNSALGARVRTVASAPNTAVIVPTPRQFKAAKVVLFLGDGTGAPATSDATGARYYRRNGRTFTSPFGALNDTEREGAACSAILGSLAGANRSISFQPEKIA